MIKLYFFRVDAVLRSSSRWRTYTLYSVATAYSGATTEEDVLVGNLTVRESLLFHPRTF